MNDTIQIHKLRAKAMTIQALNEYSDWLTKYERQQRRNDQRTDETQAIHQVYRDELELKQFRHDMRQRDAQFRRQVARQYRNTQ